MRYVDLTILDDTVAPLKDWIKKAQTHDDVIVTKPNHVERQSYINSHQIWSELKELLFEKYGHKCWYSECDIVGMDGDVDHFRPKGRSLNKDKQDIKTEGYWWLAYDYKNYRMSCQYCNQTRIDKRKSTSQGKLDYFPLLFDSPILKPGDNVLDEKYILLDPTVKEDVKLISFDDTGCIVAATNDPISISRVKDSEFIYHLDDKKFEIKRKDKWRRCRVNLELYEMMFLAENEEGMRKCVGLLKKEIDFKSTYSSVGIECVKLYSIGKVWRDVLLEVLNL